MTADEYEALWNSPEMKQMRTEGAEIKIKWERLMLDIQFRKSRLFPQEWTQEGHERYAYWQKIKELAEALEALPRGSGGNVLFGLPLP